MVMDAHVTDGGGTERLLKPQILSSIPETHDTNGADEVFLIIDGAAQNQTAIQNGCNPVEASKNVDDRRNAMDEEEGGVDPSTEAMSKRRQRDPESTFCLEFNREPSLSMMRQTSRATSLEESGKGETDCPQGIAGSVACDNLRGLASSSSFSMESDAIEIDYGDRPRKSDVDAIALVSGKDDENNSNKKTNHGGSHEGKTSPQENRSSARSPDEPRPTASGIRATLSRSAFSKPKSRFVESNYPTSLIIAEESSPPMKDTVAKSPSRATTPRGLSSMPRGSATPRIIASPLEEEEEDPFKDEDLPEKYRKRKIGVRLSVEWIAFVVLMTVMILTLTVHRLQHHSVWGLELWKWCLMILVVFCGRLVSAWLITALVILAERNFMLRKRVLYFVYGLRKSVQNCLWLGLAIVAWTLMFDPKVGRSTKNHRALSYVTKLLASFLVAAVIWLLKILLVKVMASTFHVNTYFDRIQDSIFHQYVLETLSGPPVMEIQQSLIDERKLRDQNDHVDVAAKMSASTVTGGQVSFRSTVGISQRVKGGAKEELEVPSVISVEQLHQMNQKNVSAWNMKRLINVIRHSRMSTISNTIDESMNENGRKDTEITSELEAKAAARRIFKNVAKPGAKYIGEEDLLRFMKKNEVASVFPQFEGALDSGKIKKSALKNWVVNVYLERKSLAHSLNDTKTAVDQLHQIVNAVVIIIILVVSLLVLGIATTHVIVLVSSQLLLVGFMFGNTCKTVFEAIVFVFIMHPFDVGDRCVVDGVQMIVEEMNILNTVFLRYDNEKIYYPNSILATKPISNFYRSPNMGDAIEFCVDVSTPMEKIAILKERIAEYIESKPQHWHPKHSVVVKEIENLNKMRMALHTLHTMNHQNMGEKSNRRSDLVLEMKKVFEELGIQYHLLPQAVHLSIVGSVTNQIPLQC